MTTPALPLVSQDYFDDICVENYELFSEDSYEAAVEETITQLKGKSLRHISLTHPDSENGPAIRRDISQVLFALESIKSENENAISLETLDGILGSSDTASNRYLFHHIFVVNGGFGALGHAFDCQGCDGFLLDKILRILDDFPLNADKQFRSAFQAAIPSSMLASWIACFTATESVPRKRVLLSIAYKSIRRCEANKRLWMEQKNDPWSNILVRHLNEGIGSMGPDEDFSMSPTIIICKIITCLCTFDDFSEDSSDQQQYVQSLFRAGAVAALETGLEKSTHTAIVDALRALAIQDEVVQSMGPVVDKAKQRFRDRCSCNAEGEDAMLTALVGLFRNVSANDDFKKQLGSDSLLLSTLQATMQNNTSNPQLQEHAIAWVAALALRHPDNADRLGSSSALVAAIVHAMERFPDRSSIQRQAALAFRNIASRLRDDQVKCALRSDVQGVLNNVAAKHMNCQDEVYAALRDLGLEVSSVHVERKGDSIQIRKGPLMFGQALQSNFRAEYDD